MLIDVTRTLGLDSVCWPGDAVFRTSPALSIAAGDPANLTKLEMTNHVGTHLDAPLHCIDGGAALDEWPIERFRLPAWVLEARPQSKLIGPEALERRRIDPGQAVLFKTANGELPRDRFYEEYTALALQTAKRLAELRVGLVGIDYLSVDPWAEAGSPAHRALLGAGVWLLEDLDLRAVKPGRYTLFCFPMKLHRANGAPCRAVLESVESANGG